MKKLFIIMLLLTAVSSVFGQASPQTHTLPTLDRTNVWTGVNTFTLGNLRLSSPSASCPGGSFMTGFTTQFGPVCQTVSVTAGVSSVNGASGSITLTNGTNITIVQSPSGTFTINSTGGGGGGGSGTVTAGSSYQNTQYSTASTTTVQPNNTWYSLNSAMTLTQINTLIASLNGGQYGQSANVATLTVPDGVLQQPWFNQTSQSTGQGNGGIGFNDIRTGARTEPLSKYGVTCNARNTGSFILTAGSNQVTPSYQVFSASDVGSTIVITTTIGGVPTSFAPIITAFNSGTGNVTISTNSPVSGTFSGTIGYNNKTTLQSATLGLRINNNVGQFPSGCGILTDTFQYPGAVSLVGDAQGPTTIFGFPGRDILQNPDAAAITAYTIVSNVVTFTGTNSLIPGQYVTLSGLTTGTYLNGQALTVLAANLSATSWSAAFVHANVSSTTDSGIASPQGLGGAAVALRNIKFLVDNSIDATVAWNSIDENGVTTSHAGYNRPLAEYTAASNNPLGPGWATGPTNGVASITAGSSVICVPTTGRSPISGNQIIFRDTVTTYKGTVTSLTGAGCSAGYGGVTLSAAIPNVAGNTIAEAEWVSTSAVQSLSTAMTAGTISYPLTISVALNTAPTPLSESNVATHGWVKIGSEEYAYLGGSTSTTPSTLILRSGPTTTVGWAIGTAVVPESPCSASRHTPYPVLPSVHTNTATPVGAEFYPSFCVGNSAISMPENDGLLYDGSGYSGADIENILVLAKNNNDSNNSAAYYVAGNQASYNTTYNNIQAIGTTYGIVQGPAATNTLGLSINGVGPTGDGNHYSNLHLANAVNFAFNQLENSTIERVDAYTTGYNQYDGTTIGSYTAFVMGLSLDERNGNVIENTSSISLDNINSEPETGTHAEVPPYALLDCYECVYTNAALEGIPTVLGGGSQIFIGGQFSTESYNYGKNNVIRNATSASSGNLAPGHSYASIQNYGLELTETVPVGGGGPNLWGAPFTRGSSDGQTDQFASYGNTVPFVDSKGGMIYADEFVNLSSLESNGMDNVAVYDATAAVTGRYTDCNLAVRTSCNTSHFDGASNIYIGSQNRIPADQTVLSFMVKGSAALSSGISVNIGANDDGSGSCVSPNSSVVRFNFPVTTSWALKEVPVDFTNYGNCFINISVIGGGTFPDTRFQYFDFLPVPSRLLLRTGTFTSGAACAVNGEFLGSDSSNLYMCEGGTVALLPFGGSGGGGGSGSVTSVAVTVPAFLTVSGSPITSTGTIAIGSGSFSGNVVLASPNGSTGTLTPRALVAADIPTLPYITSGTGDATFSGTGSVATTVRALNGQNLAALTTGLLQNNTGTGVPTIAQNINITGSVINATYSQSGVYSVPFSATPTFDLSQGDTQLITLTGNVTNSALSNLPTGSFTRRVSVLVCQDATGGRTFANPTWANGWTPPTLNASQCTNTMFTATSAGLYADGFNTAFCQTSGTAPDVCGNAVKGYLAIPAGTNPTLQVNTTSVGTSSVILLQEDSSIGASLSPAVTCNATIPTALVVTARGAGSNFTAEAVGTFSGNPVCLSFAIVNP